MNESGCIRTQFLDFFNEPQEFRDNIRGNRCCSNCNPELQLGPLDQHYLYSEHGNKLNDRRKTVLGLITAWAEKQVPIAFPNPAFRPTVDCFISADQLTQLAKDAHEILTLVHLQKALRSWHFFESHGEELLSELRAANYAAEAMPQESRKTRSEKTHSGKTTVRRLAVGRVGRLAVGRVGRLVVGRLAVRRQRHWNK